MDIEKRIRRVKKTWGSVPTLEGAGVSLKRAFGFRELPQLDPFLLLDNFHSDNPNDYAQGFPWHPHRGMETITYILDGNVEHQDSLGNGGIIKPGDVQWMTAGSGIIHQEMPKGDAKGRMWGFQLWTNLPKSHKMMDPRYREVKQNSIPHVKTPGGATVRVIAGEVSGVQGSVREVVTDPEFLDVSLPADSAFERSAGEGHTVFAFVVEGEGCFESGRYFQEGSIILYGPGNTIVVASSHKPLRFLLISGKPLNEPVAWYGPIVMNTQDELRTAFEEFREGRFIKHPRQIVGT